MSTAVTDLRPDTGSKQSDVDAALGAVIDPELDEPITDLGFVTERRVCGDTGDTVVVRLRLPIAVCSPNFAYLMVSDAHDAISALGWVREVRVILQDHHDADRIDRGVAADLGFTGTYPDEADGTAGAAPDFSGEGAHGVHRAGLHHHGARTPLGG